MTIPVICVVGTGGTISCVSESPLDTLDYPEFSTKREIGALLADLPPALRDAFDLRPISSLQLNSTDLVPADWQALAATILRLRDETPEVAGFVVTHGTATLEETAFALDQVLAIEQPVLLVGAQRPGSAIGADGPANLASALRAAAAPELRGEGVLVAMNDEIHAASSVTKLSTYRLHTFGSPLTGPLGVVDGDGVRLFRRRRPGGRGLFLPDAFARAPRVDIASAYAGADGVAVRAFLQAGARGIVSAGMLPGMTTPAERAALAEAHAAGCVVVQSIRGGSGRVAARRFLREQGFVAAGSLPPHKARILLMLALTGESDPARLQVLFDAAEGD